MTPEEMAALREVGLRILHETEDDELQAFLWRVMEYADELELRRLGALQALAG